VPFEGDNFVAVAMRHVNEPAPSVREIRPDVSPRLDWAIQQAMAKVPEDRFESMDDFAAELEACDAELDGNEGATMIAPARSPRAAPPRRMRRRRRLGLWPAVLLGVGLAALAGGLLGALLLRDNTSSTGSSPPPPAGTVHLRGVTAFDPEGSPPGEEHNDTAKYATDNNPTTYWRTEHYNGAQLAKSGVGVVLDAGRPVALRSLTVSSATPGFTAVIKAGGSTSGPFSVDSAPTTVGSSTTFQLSGKNARYYVVWITDLGGNDQVQIQELKTR
jgi:eukaryotic-like serine/threonine-protein kinase